MYAKDITVLVCLGILIALIAYLIYKIRIINSKIDHINKQAYRFGRHMASDLVRNIQAVANLLRILPDVRTIPLGDSFSAMPDFIFAVCRNVLSRKPNVIFECGSGISTVMLASCLRENGNGHLYSLEHDSDFAEKTRLMLSEYSLARFATVIDAPLTPVYINNNTSLWYSIDQIPDIDGVDMIVIDGPPAPLGPLIRYPAGPVLFPRLSPHGQVFLDDAKRDDEMIILKLWKEKFPRMGVDYLPSTKGCVKLYFINEDSSAQK